MHIALVFFMDTVRTSFGNPGRMWGRVAANHSFVRALARADAPFELTIIVPTRQDTKLLERTLLTDIERDIRIVAFSDMGQALRKTPPDVLHSLDPCLWLNARIRQNLKWGNAIVTGVTHSLANDHFASWALLNNANGIDSRDCLICTTATAEQVITNIFNNLSASQPAFLKPQTRVIPLGIPEDMSLALKHPRDGVRPDLSAPFTVLSLARFNPSFKMDFLPILNMAKLLSSRSTRPVKLVLAGASDGRDYVSFLETQSNALGVDDSIEFVIDPDDEKKARLYDAADVFLSLSDNVQETFGLTIIEALASGLPVVASDWDGYRSLLRDGETGFLIPTTILDPNPDWETSLAIQLDSISHLWHAQTTAVDLELAADRIIALSQDQDLCARMSQAAKAAAHRYQWEGLIPEYLDLWQKLMESSKLTDKASGQNERSSAIGFISDFSDYASGFLLPTDEFSLSAIGAELKSGKLNIQLYQHVDEILSVPLIARLLSEITEPATVETLRTQMKAIYPSTTDQELDRQLIWLYKNGFIQRNHATSSV